MHYLFHDAETGEFFFVEADSKSEARKIALEIFERPKLYAVMSVDESEWYPYDVY